MSLVSAPQINKWGGPNPTDKESGATPSRLTELEFYLFDDFGDQFRIGGVAGEVEGEAGVGFFAADGHADAEPGEEFGAVWSGAGRWGQSFGLQNRRGDH